jgi:TolA-binding protein
MPLYLKKDTIGSYYQWGKKGKRFYFRTAFGKAKARQEAILTRKSTDLPLIPRRGPKGKYQPTFRNVIHNTNQIFNTAPRRRRRKAKSTGPSQSAQNLQAFSRQGVLEQELRDLQNSRGSHDEAQKEKIRELQQEIEDLIHIQKTQILIVDKGAKAKGSPSKSESQRTSKNELPEITPTPIPTISSSTPIPISSSSSSSSSSVSKIPPPKILIGLKKPSPTIKQEFLTPTGQLNQAGKLALENANLIAKLPARRVPIKKAGDGDKQSPKDKSGSNETTNFQLERIMHRYKEFLGCICSDQIPELIIPLIKPQSRGAFIINTENSHQAGAHWCAFFFDGRPTGSHSIEFYNSLGDPIKKEWLEQCTAISDALESDQYLKFKESSPIRNQQLDSSYCGYFCTKFLMERFRGNSFADASGYNQAVKEVPHIRKQGEEIKEFKYLVT